MTFEICPTCGQSHPGCVEHRTLQGEWCTPAEREKGITREMAITALVNLHHSIRGEDCPREAAVGCATSAVMQLKRERDELHAALQQAALDLGNHAALWTMEGKADLAQIAKQQDEQARAALVKVVPAPCGEMVPGTATGECAAKRCVLPAYHNGPHSRR